VLKQAIVRRATEADVDPVSEDEVGDDLEAEATVTPDSGTVTPVVRADTEAPTTYPTSSLGSTSLYGNSETDRNNLR
jgi:hypothetical protein